MDRPPRQPVPRPADPVPPRPAPPNPREFDPGQDPDPNLDDLAVLAAYDDWADAGGAAARLRAAGLADLAERIDAATARLVGEGLLAPAAGGAGWRPAGAFPSGRLLAAVAARRAGEIATRTRMEREREQVERLRRDLLSTISHELRTPLTLIRTSIGLLLDPSAAPDEAMRQRLLHNVKGSSDRMQSLVADLLDLARMEGNRLDLRLAEVDLGQLAADAVSLMRPITDGKDQFVSLDVAVPAPVVRGDARRLERVLLNLLSNAAAFAPIAGRIGVTVAHAGDEATVEVSDTGPGIPPEAMPRLFDQFYTGRTSSTRHGVGVGLGLPIARGIIAAHGGRIAVDSAVGAGTTVRVALPVAGPRDRNGRSGRAE